LKLRCCGCRYLMSIPLELLPVRAARFAQIKAGVQFVACTDVLKRVL